MLVGAAEAVRPWYTVRFLLYADMEMRLRVGGGHIDR